MHGEINSVAIHCESTAAVDSKGHLWAWGKNSYGQLGLGDTAERDIPTRVGTDNDWSSVDCFFHTLAIKSDGTLWAWGYNGSGQLGLGDTSDRWIPTQVGTENQWVYVVCGSDYTVAIKSDGTLWAWGGNSYGQLGLGDTSNRFTPTRVGTDNTWVRVACGYSHTLALKSDGSLWAWGYNYNGQLGLGDTSNRLAPTRVGTDNNWVSVECGSCFTLAIKSDGTLWVWGQNNLGQLGLGDTTDRWIPTLNENISVVSSCQVWFEWGTSAALGNSTAPQAMTSPGTFSFTLTGLTPCTTYYYRAVASSSSGMCYGDILSFTTKGWWVLETQRGTASAPATWFATETATEAISAPPTGWGTVGILCSVAGTSARWEPADFWIETLLPPASWAPPESWSGILESPASWLQAEFLPVATSALVPAPNLSRPLDKENTNNNMPSFNWENLLPADNFDLEVDNDADFDTPEISVTVTGTSYTPTSGLQDGLYYWRVRQWRTGACSDWSEVRAFRIDTVAPPVPVLIYPPDGLQDNDSTPTFSWTSVEENSLPVTYRIRFSLTQDFSSWWATDWTTENSLTVWLADNLYYWRVEARDNAGNTSLSAVRSLRVDTVAPQPPTLSSPPDHGWGASRATLVWNAVSDVSQPVLYLVQLSDYPDFAVVKEESGWISGTSYTTGAKNHGEIWYWRVRARDNAGNESIWSPVRCYQVDAHAPSVPILSSPANGSTLQQTSVSLSWNPAYDADSGVKEYEVSVSGSTYRAASTSLSLSFSNGTYSWKVRTFDVAGNASDWSEEWSFTVSVSAPPGGGGAGGGAGGGENVPQENAPENVRENVPENDTLPPEIRILRLGPEEYIYALFSVWDPSGVKYVYAWVDNEFTPVRTTENGLEVRVENAAEGMHSILIQAADNFGNENLLLLAYSVRKRPQPPRVTAAVVDNTLVISIQNPQGSPLSFSLYVYVDGKLYRTVSVSLGALENAEHTLDLSGLGPGEHRIEIRDPEGNLLYSKSLLVQGKAEARPEATRFPLWILLIAPAPIAASYLLWRLGRGPKEKKIIVRPKPPPTEKEILDILETKGGELTQGSATVQDFVRLMAPIAAKRAAKRGTGARHRKPERFFD